MAGNNRIGKANLQGRSFRAFIRFKEAGAKSKSRRGLTMKRIYFALLVVLVWSSNLPAQTPFYEGKTVTIRVGFTAGGAFDVWGRIIAAHIGKYIPGNPTVVVQNMTGGGSMIAANYVYGVAKPDGLTLGIVSPGIYIQQLSGHPEVRFEWFKNSWIGSPEKTDRIFYIRADTPYKALEDLRNAVDPRSAALRVSVPRLIISPVFSRMPLGSS